MRSLTIEQQCDQHLEKKVCLIKQHHDFCLIKKIYSVAINIVTKK